MELYDIFVLVVAAVLLYFLYRIFSPIIRGLIGMFKAGKRMVDNHNAKKAAQEAPQEQYDEEEYDEEPEAGVVYEDPDSVEKVLGSPMLQNGFAKLIIHYNGKLWDYLCENFDASSKHGFKALIAMGLLVQITEKFFLGDNEDVVNAINACICEQDSDYDAGALRLSWPGVWKVFMEYKPTEEEYGTAASMLMVRLLSPVAGPGKHDELYELTGTAIRYLEEQCDELWEKA